jgi:hypothetical protein
VKKINNEEDGLQGHTIMKHKWGIYVGKKRV